MLNSPDTILKIPYTLTLKVPGASPDSVSYTIALSEAEEDNPLPRLQQSANDIQQSFQQKGFQRIGRSDLQAILSEWAKEIEVGDRDVRLSRELEPVQLDLLDAILDSGCPILPSFMSPSLDGVQPELTFLPPLAV